MKRSDWMTDGTVHVKKDAIIAFEPWGYELTSTTRVYVGQVSFPFVATLSQVEEMLFDENEVTE